MAAIEVKSIIKKFQDFTAVDNLTFSVPENKIFGLLGSNGAGKTTTINMMTGLLLSDSGSIKILDMDASTQIEEIRKHIALVPQTISLYEDLTIYENLEFFGGMYIEKEIELQKRIEDMIELFKLDDKRNTIISELSGGYKRRCSIGCALISKPKILFLDEPLTGIDMYTNNIVMDFIRQIKDMTIIFTTHSIKEAESVCDNILFIDKGRKVLEGTPKQIKKNYSKHFGETLTIEFDKTIDVKKVESHLRKAGYKIKHIHVKGKIISFTTKDLGNTVVEVIDSLKKLRKHVKNIDITKPDLRTILSHVIKDETAKSNKKRV